MRREEAQQQAIVVKWAREIAFYLPNKYPFLCLLHASLNGVDLTELQRKIMKGQGQLNGVLSDDQKEFIKNVKICGYQAEVCYSAKEAIDVLENYYK